MRQLITLYPRAWRERYGLEILSLIEGQPTSLGLAWDLMRGAIAAWVRPDIAITRLAFAGGPGGAIFLRGVGFRPAGLWMPSPIVIERDGRTLTVQQLVVTPERTDLIYEIACAPADAARVGRRHENVVLLDGAQAYRVSRRHVQSGQVLPGKLTRTLRLEPMPLTVGRVELQVSSEILGAWSHSIMLEPFERETAAEQIAPNSAATHAGITLTLRAVNFTSTETAVEIEATTDVTGAVFTGLGGLDGRRDGPTALTLRDQRGRVYNERVRRDAVDYADPSGQMETALFEPLPVEGLDLEIEIPFVCLEDPSGRLAFELPVTAPVTGVLGGNAVRVVGARAFEIPAGAYRGPGLAVDLDLGGWQNDRRVLKPRHAELDGRLSPICFLGRLRMTDPEPQSQIGLRAEDPLRAKRVALEGATVQIRGPWRLRLTPPSGRTTSMDADK